MHDTRSVLILGAGLGGMTAAQTLAGRIAARVYEPADTLEWLPNLHELVSGLKRPHNLRVARAPLLARAGHDWQRLSVTGIDAHRHRVTLADGSEQAFSHLIVAVGGARSGYPVPGVDEHAIRCRSVADGHAIALRLQRLAARPGPVRVVLVGGGVEGVEVLGELLRGWRRRTGLEITLVEAADRLLPELPVAVADSVRAACAGQPVRLLCGRRLQAVSAEAVQLADGEVLAADLVIWSAGVRPSPLLRQSHLSDPSGFAPVNPLLHSNHADGVYVIGDAVASIDGLILPKQAYHAMDMGRLAALNILAERAGRAPQAYRPAAKPQLVTFGDMDTFLVTPAGRVLAGPALSTLRELIYQLGLASFDRRRLDRRAWALWRRMLDSGIDGTITLLRHPGVLRGWPRFRVLES